MKLFQEWVLALSLEEKNFTREKGASAVTMEGFQGSFLAARTKLYQILRTR